jgi:hypothetical protein
MLDPLTTAEIQALRLKLQLFASRQSDATVRSQCLAVDTKLAEALEGETRSFAKSWQILLNNLKRLYVGRRARRSKRPQCIFLQDFAVAAASQLKSVAIRGG